MAITEEKLVEYLNDLIKLDVDALNAYQQAIAAVDRDAIRDQLISFQKDHRRHIADLSQMVRNHHREPVSPRPGVMGFFLAGMTAIRSATGTEGALKAMEINEKLTNRTYLEVSQDPDLPRDVRAVVERNLADEKRHLAYIQQALRDRLWEAEETIQPS